MESALEQSSRRRDAFSVPARSLSNSIARHETSIHITIPPPSSSEAIRLNFHFFWTSPLSHLFIILGFELSALQRDYHKGPQPKQSSARYIHNVCMYKFIMLLIILEHFLELNRKARKSTITWLCQIICYGVFNFVPFLVQEFQEIVLVKKKKKYPFAKILSILEYHQFRQIKNHYLCHIIELSYE